MCAFGASTWPLASCFVLHDGMRKMCALYFLYGVLLFCLHVLNVTMRNRVVCPLKKKGIVLTDTGGVKPLMPYHFVRYNICTTFLYSPIFLLPSILLAIFMTGWYIFSFVFEKDIVFVCQININKLFWLVQLIKFIIIK